MTKRIVLAGVLALALLGTPSFARAGVHVSFGFGIPLPFFGVVAPAPVVVAPPPPAYYAYPPVVAYGPPAYYAPPVVVYGRHYPGRRVGWYRHGHRW